MNGLAVTASEPVVRALAARPDVREVRLDRPIPRPVPVPAAAAPSAEISEWNLDQIRAPEVWAIASAYTGVGSVVGSFDTGVDGTHPNLAPRYRGDDATNWLDLYGEHTSPFDADGHGTHTTGTAMGGDAGGTNIGVAPGAQWIAAKAWDDNGVGLVSAFHQIFQCFLAPGGDPGSTITVTDTTRNVGGGLADASTTSFYLSTNPTLDAADLWLGGRAVPALAGARRATARQR